MAKNVTLEAIIKLRDEFSSQIENIKKSIQNLEKTMKSSGKSAKPLAESLKHVNGNLKNVTKTGVEAFKKLEKSSAEAAHHTHAAWVATLAKLTGLFLAAREAFDMSKEAAQAQQAFQAFALTVQQRGKDVTKVFEEIKEASGGLVSNRDLVAAANQAIALGIPIEKLGKLMEVARYRARLFGTDVSQAFSDIVTGIGRLSPMILDNLGITVKLGEVYDEYAKKLNKTADQLTAQEQKQALLNAVLEQSEKTVKNFSRVHETAFEKFQKLQSTLENIQEEVGKALIPLFTEFAKLMNDTLPYFEKSIIGWRMIAATIKLALKDLQVLWVWAQDKFETSWDTISQILAQNTHQWRWQINQIKKDLADLNDIHNDINWDELTKDLPQLKLKAEVSEISISPATAQTMRSIMSAIDEVTLPDLEKQKREWDKWKEDLLKQAREAGLATGLLQIRLDEIVQKKKAEIEEKYRRQKLQKDVQVQTQIAEAALQQMQKVLEYQNQLGEIDKKGYLQKKLEILKERLQVLQWQYKHTFDPVQAQMVANKIADVNGQLEVTRKKLEDLHVTLGDAITRGLKDAHNQLKVTMDDWRELGSNTAMSLRDAFSDFFFDAMRGKLKSLETYFKSFAQTVMRYIADILAKMAAMKILESFGTKLPTVHTGGLVTAQGIKRFHDGGLVTRSDEVPAILQVGEVVLSRNQVAALAQSRPKVIINVENKTGVPFEFDVARAQRTRENEIINVVIRRLQIDPNFKQLVRGG